jgi:hypothetical protein
MGYDEHEMMIEYSEMTSFNFNSKEYQEVKRDFIECKEFANGLEWLVKNFTTKFKKAENV